MPLPGARGLLRLAGLALAVLCLAFVGLQLAEHRPWRLEPRLLAALLGWSLFGAVVYALASLLVSSAWRHLLAACGHELPPAVAHAVYGRSQIAKYLPTNALHVVGRHLMGRALGVSHARLVRSALYESAARVACAGLLAGPLLAGPLWLLLPAGLVGLAALAGRRRPSPPPSPEAAPAGVVPPAAGVAGSLAAAGLRYVAFFLVVGGVLWLLTVAAAGGPEAGSTVATPTGFARSLSINALAWLVGFLSVGAAAGVGVREAVLIASLSPAIGPAEAAAVAVALRAVTVLGDTLFFLGCLALPLRPTTAAPAPARHPG
ncbi:MAG TPA: hypothetical protein VFG47_17410 [Geminicoccaceae bacterium]|nr:hypothetical protein [Geminicoccaceae bacterium]